MLAESGVEPTTLRSQKRAEESYQRLTSPLKQRKATGNGQNGHGKSKKKISPRKRAKIPEVPVGARVIVADKASTHFSKVGEVTKFNPATGNVHVIFQEAHARPRPLASSSVQILENGASRIAFVIALENAFSKVLAEGWLLELTVFREIK